jgi:predicted ATP-binding protein involved in virulence
MYLAGIRLKNYCGYKDTKLRFLDSNDQVLKLITIFGPNGVGKSSLLEALKLISNPFIYIGRDTRLAFRRLTYNQDYNPTYGFIKDAKEFLTFEDLEKEYFENENSIDRTLTTEQFKTTFDELVKDNEYNMEIEAAFEENDDFRTVFIQTDGLKESNLPPKSRGYAYCIDADNPVNLMKFQVSDEMEDIFLEIAETVYKFPCKFNEPVKEKLKDFDGNEREVNIYTDLIINKDGVNVHYKSMSAGEKKIATMLSYLCDPIYMDNMDIVIIDNCEMHVHFKRHAKFIDKLLEKFPNKQFIVTTHSGTLIDHIANKYGEQHLFDLEILKDK